MALVTHQIQGSNTTFPLRASSLINGSNLNHHVLTLHLYPLKRSIRLRLRASVHGSKVKLFKVARLDFTTDLELFTRLRASVHGSKVKLFKVASFKGSAQNNESGSRGNGSKGSKNSVKVFYIPKEREETSVPVPYTSKEDEGVGITPAISRLLEKWLNILRSPSSSQVGDEEIIGEKPSSSKELQPIQTNVRTKEKGAILKEICCLFLGLDATIKTPLLIFAPLYLAVNIIYGSQVSKELMPLWIFGPPAVVLYIKMLQLLWSLYLFGFKQTVKLIKNFPTYYAVASSYVTQGKLKGDTKAVLFWPVISMKNMDCMKNMDYKKKMKELEEWLLDKYLDFVESIWPRYCGAIRFLKRANLI